MPLRELSAVFFYSALEVFSFFVLLSAFELSFFLLSADFSSVSFMELARWVKSGSLSLVRVRLLLYVLISSAAVLFSSASLPSSVIR